MENKPYSGNRWIAVANSSWDKRHVEKFGNRSGYVICYKNSNQELAALSTVIGQAFVKQAEIDANARIIEHAPEMSDLIEKFAMLNEDHYKDIAGFIQEARKINRYILGT